MGCAAAAALAASTLVAGASPSVAGVTSPAEEGQPTAAPAAAAVPGLGPEPEDAVVRWSVLETGIGDTSGALVDPRSCGIRDDRSLWCWGDEDANLADGERERLELAPRPVGGSRQWSDLALGSRHGCAIDAAAHLWCWGTNNHGQLGDGSLTERDELRRTSGPDGWTKITAAYAQSCGITDDEALWCWGINSSGQLGDGTTITRTIPRQVAPERAWSDVAAGSGWGYEGRTHGHTCAVATAGTLWCWGENDVGQLGIGKITGRRTTPVQVGTDSTWAGVTAGRHASCATKSDGSLWCWGENTRGRLGDGTTTTRLAPVEIMPGRSWTSVVMSRWHTCGTQDDGSAWCWGANADGGLGDGTTQVRLEPTAVLGGLSWASLSVAGRNTCGVTDDGTGICWGDGWSGQRGTGELDRALAPSVDDRVRGDVGPWRSTWTTLAGGESLGCGVLADRRAACWSEGSIPDLPSGGSYAQPVHERLRWHGVSVGQRWMCGIRGRDALVCAGSVAGTVEPDEPVLPGSSWAGVDVGANHACAWQADGSLWCWGSNFYGQLGTGDFTARPEPVQVPGSWRSASAGDTHTCGFQTDGSLWCWGSNGLGELGLGQPGPDLAVPSRVGDRTDWAQVSAGQFATCATTTDHAGYCWGANRRGQLGDGTTTTRPAPNPVIGPADWSWITAESQSSHACGLRLDGTAWCWGENGGRLGDGGTDDSLVPVPVAGGHRFASVSLAYGGGCGVTEDGRAWCWGRFDGDGTQDLHLEPAPLLSVRGL